MSRKFRRAAAAAAVVMSLSALPLDSALAAAAIVVSPDNSVAYWSTHKESETLAAEIALGKCGERFGQCFVKTTFSNGCLAVATARTLGGGVHWSWSVRPTSYEAQAAAMASCAKDGFACYLKTVSCEQPA